MQGRLATTAGRTSRAYHRQSLSLRLAPFYFVAPSFCNGWSATDRPRASVCGPWRAALLATVAGICVADLLSTAAGRSGSQRRAAFTFVAILARCQPSPIREVTGGVRIAVASLTTAVHPLANRADGDSESCKRRGVRWCVSPPR
jgi:hypothetical protein